MGGTGEASRAAGGTAGDADTATAGSDTAVAALHLVDTMAGCVTRGI